MSKSHSEQSTDKNPTKHYEARFFWTQHNQATLTIEANSLEEAEKMADEMSSEDIDDWEPSGGEMFVDDVRPLLDEDEGGQGNE